MSTYAHHRVGVSFLHHSHDDHFFGSSSDLLLVPEPGTLGPCVTCGSIVRDKLHISESQDLSLIATPSPPNLSPWKSFFFKQKLQITTAPMLPVREPILKFFPPTIFFPPKGNYIILVK